MREKIFIKCLIFLTILLISCVICYAELYSGGPWRGRVIDADTKKPIEGAVVVAVWHRAYDCGFGSPTFLQKATEVLTDKEGSFEIPAYNEKRDKFFLRTQDKLSDTTSLSICSGPEIRVPNFIIYKPSYGNYPKHEELGIYAIGPGLSSVEYQEYHKEVVKDQKITWAKKKIKTFPEGLIYYGAKCKAKINELAKTLPFSSGSFFIPMEKAKERIEKLEILLDCPDSGEPIPGSMHGFRNDIVNPLHKGGYIIIELPKLKTWAERHKTNMLSLYGDISKKELPLLNELIEKENDWLKKNKGWGGK